MGAQRSIGPLRMRQSQGGHSSHSEGLGEPRSEATGFKSERRVGFCD